MNLHTYGQEVEILMIEDDPADVHLVEEALRAGQPGTHLQVVPDGEEAIAYLRGEGPHVGSLLPDLILLDLKMPKKNGLEVLSEIKADEVLRKIPVIVLTTSDAPEDIFKAYDLQASCYITKPSDLEEFERVMNSIKDFCLTIVKLPPRDIQTVRN